MTKTKKEKHAIDHLACVARKLEAEQKKQYSMCDKFISMNHLEYAVAHRCKAEGLGFALKCIREQMNDTR